MKDSNIFLIKKFVDKEISELVESVDTQKIVEKFINEIQDLEEEDFIEVLISCFIPDTYRDNGKREKLYTKLAEVLVGEWWNRIGGDFVIPTKKSGTEDVELNYSNKSIVCDAKIFRLGRSQKAPNVKDFLKLASVKLWMNNLVKRYQEKGKEQIAIGGMVTYSSLHEWEGESEVYQECTNKDIPVVMLPYEILALLLKNKERYSVEDFIKLWNYEYYFKSVTKSKETYWKVIDKFIIELLNISEYEYKQMINEYRNKIIISVGKYKEIIIQEMNNNYKEIEERLNSFDTIEDMKEYAKEELGSYVNKQNNDYITRINKFRKF